MAKLIYLKKSSNGTWSQEVIDPTIDHVHDCRIGIDNQDQPHVAYPDANGTQQKYAVRLDRNEAMRRIR